MPSPVFSPAPGQDAAAPIHRCSYPTPFDSADGTKEINMTITDTTQSIGEFLAQNAEKIDELSKQASRAVVIATFLELREQHGRSRPRLELIQGGVKA